MPSANQNESKSEPVASPIAMQSKTCWCAILRASALGESRRTVFVVRVLEQIGIDAANLDAMLLRQLRDCARVATRFEIPQNVDGHRRARAGQLVNARGVPRFFLRWSPQQRVAGTCRKRVPVSAKPHDGTSIWKASSKGNQSVGFMGERFNLPHLSARRKLNIANKKGSVVWNQLSGHATGLRYKGNSPIKPRGYFQFRCSDN